MKAPPIGTNVNHLLQIDTIVGGYLYAGSHQVKISSTENLSSLLLIRDKWPKKLLARHPTLTAWASAVARIVESPLEYRGHPLQALVGQLHH
jgi:hypothetical protein